MSEEERRIRSRREMIVITYVTAVAAAAVILLLTFSFQLLEVSGSSMEPALSEKDLVILRRHAHCTAGDIVAFSCGDQILLKRVIGCPGDCISIGRDGIVFVNGEILRESYVSDSSTGPCESMPPILVPEDSYFVMGDNRAVSVDSRSASIGFVDTGQIEGKVLMHIRPLRGVSNFFQRRVKGGENERHRKQKCKAGS